MRSPAHRLPDRSPAAFVAGEGEWPFAFTSRAGGEDALDLLLEAHLALAHPRQRRFPEEGEMPEPAMEKMLRRHPAGRLIVGKDPRKLRRAVALEDFDDGL